MKPQVRANRKRKKKDPWGNTGYRDLYREIGTPSIKECFKFRMLKEDKDLKEALVKLEEWEKTIRLPLSDVEKTKSNLEFKEFADHLITGLSSSLGIPETLLRITSRDHFDFGALFKILLEDGTLGTKEDIVKYLAFAHGIKEPFDLKDKLHLDPTKES